MCVSPPWLWALQTYIIFIVLLSKPQSCYIDHDAWTEGFTSCDKFYVEPLSLPLIWILNNSVSQSTTELLHWAQWLCVMQQNSLLDCKNMHLPLLEQLIQYRCQLVYYKVVLYNGSVMEVTNENIFEHLYSLEKKVVKL